MQRSIEQRCLLFRSYILQVKHHSKYSLIGKDFSTNKFIYFLIFNPLCNMDILGNSMLESISIIQKMKRRERIVIWLQN